MTPRSSISSFRNLNLRAFGFGTLSRHTGLRNLALFLVLAPLLFTLLALWALPDAGLSYRYAALYQYQLEKIDRLDPKRPVWVLVGDSSLGNAINSSLWESREAQQADPPQIVNLALTGNFGYAGSFNMLRRVSMHNRVERVVVFQTVDLLTREISEDLFQLTKPQTERSNPLYQLWSNIEERVNRHSLSTLFSFRRTNFQSTAIVNDYSKQGPRKGIIKPKQLKISHLRPEKVKYLKILAEFCTAEGMNCAYAHGPLASPGCEKMSDYITAADRLIAETGLPIIANTPVCIPKLDYGDSSDHVSPDSKDKFTLTYRRLISATWEKALKRN